jgi:outer membrane lipoprotein SlyB
LKVLCGFWQRFCTLISGEFSMNKRLLSAALSAGLFLGAAGQADAALIQQQRVRHHYVQRGSAVKHKRHMKTVKRVGIGAAGGAAIGALAGGGKGAGIGALAGAGAGALYDRHKKHKGQ